MLIVLINLVDVRIVGVSLKASTSTRLRQTGKDLREIIDKARAHGQYKALTNQLSTFKDAMTYSGSTIILIIIIVIIVLENASLVGYPATKKIDCCQNNEKTAGRPYGTKSEAACTTLFRSVIKPTITLGYRRRRATPTSAEEAPGARKRCGDRPYSKMSHRINMYTNIF